MNTYTQDEVLEASKRVQDGRKNSEIASLLDYVMHHSKMVPRDSTQEFLEKCAKTDKEQDITLFGTDEDRKELKEQSEAKEAATNTSGYTASSILQAKRLVNIGKNGGDIASITDYIIYCSSICTLLGQELEKHAIETREYDIENIIPNKNPLHEITRKEFGSACTRVRMAIEAYEDIPKDDLVIMTEYLSKSPIDVDPEHFNIQCKAKEIVDSDDERVPSDDQYVVSKKATQDTYSLGTSAPHRHIGIVKCYELFHGILYADVVMKASHQESEHKAGMSEKLAEQLNEEAPTVKLGVHEVKTSSVIMEAHKVITTRGQDDYGDAERCMSKIGKQWYVYLYQKYGIHCAITAEDVCYMMADLKKVRQMHKSKRDNIIDGIGYLALVTECNESDRCMPQTNNKE